MTLSELCIRRPVMTVLLSIATVIAGAVAYVKIPVAALPSFNTPVISVSASLPGASPENMAASVALPLEKEFSTIDGITVISSTNSLGSTSITLEFNNDRDIDKAAVDVQAALLRAQKRLPIEMTVPPSYRKINPADTPVLVVRMSSPSISLSDLNQYAENLLSPNLSTISGVAQVLVYGAKRYAVRVRVHPDALANRNLTVDDVAVAINKANSNSPVGVLDGPRQAITIYANPQLVRPEEFANLIISQKNGLPIYLKDVAEVVESYEDVKTLASSNGERSIAIAVLRQPSANTVEVVNSVKALLPQLQKQMPESVKLQLLNDRSLSIIEAIHDVNLTLALTVLLVILVIFLFLKHISATVIPSISLPISLIGAFFLLYFLGYSLDNISLLGITLAVGLVVDDAIVVLENIMRYVEEGMDPLKASLKGSKEVGFTIISISISLVAVFIPLFFMAGPIGLLFREFAVVVSLTILEAFNNDKERVTVLNGGSYWLINDFVGFQFGELKEECAPHRGVLKLIHSHSKLKGYPKGNVTLKEKDKEKDKEKEGGVGETKPPSCAKPVNNFREFKLGTEAQYRAGKMTHAIPSLVSMY